MVVGGGNHSGRLLLPEHSVRGGGGVSLKLSGEGGGVSLTAPSV